MADDPPRKAEYTRALEHMSRIARELVWDEKHQRYVGDPPLEYETELDKVHITDPFAFQLRWTIRPNGSLTSGLLRRVSSSTEIPPMPAVRASRWGGEL